MTSEMNFGPILFDEKTGFHYRENSGHLATAMEPPTEYRRLELHPGDVVMDVGAHVGGFLRHAVITHGIRNIFSFEPSPDTFQVLQMNYRQVKKDLLRSGEELSPESCQIYERAIGPEEGSFNLWLTKNHGSKSSCMASLEPKRGRFPVEVKVLSFADQLEKIRPTVLKMDTEGSEYMLDWTVLPDSVGRLALELHSPRRGDRGFHLVETLLGMGFREVLPKSGRSVTTGRGWTWVGVWVR